MDVQGMCSFAEEILPSAPDLVRLFGKWSKAANVPGWNGFMEQVTSGQSFTRSNVLMLPFINSQPSDYNTILTSLLIASDKCKSHNQKTCFVTFDQPLYVKARDIVQSGQEPDLNNVVVRLGGFHLLMSFMEAIGTIMNGNGLKPVSYTHLDVYKRQVQDCCMHARKINENFVSLTTRVCPLPISKQLFNFYHQVKKKCMKSHHYQTKALVTGY